MTDYQPNPDDGTCSVECEQYHELHGNTRPDLDICPLAYRAMRAVARKAQVTLGPWRTDGSQSYEETDARDELDAALDVVSKLLLEE